MFNRRQFYQTISRRALAPGSREEAGEPDASACRLVGKLAPGSREDRTSAFQKPEVGKPDASACRLMVRLHRDERGTISIITVFTLLMFTMLLVMILNVATHVDDKVKMQNAADAAAYSGGVVLARGMNAVAFTNHLLTDVFAITAFLREGRDRNAEQLTPEILDEWERTGQTFSRASFEKFRTLGEAIGDKIPKERALVGAFGNLTEAASAHSLPVFEMVLREELIPEFQRSLVRMTPGLVNQTTTEIAYRHGLRNSELANLPQPPTPRANDRGPQVGLLWRMNVVPVFDGPQEEDPLQRTLPAVDPAPSGSDYAFLPNPEEYLTTALTERRELSKFYLEQWTGDKLRIFDRQAEMSQFSNLWRIFTCAHLNRLLNEEYPLNNLPMVIRRTEAGVDVETLRASGRDDEVNAHLERNFNFLSVVYRKHLPEAGPGVFHNPLKRESDALAFAQVGLFVPRGRYVLASQEPPDPNIGLGGTLGFDSGLSMPADPPSGEADAVWVRENWPRHWDLLNQNWTAKLVPATAEAIPDILQARPGDAFPTFRPPNLGGAPIRAIRQINTH